MKSILSITVALCYMALGANAQFQFFEQMFNGGHQQQQHRPPQDGPSDSNWYRTQVENGRLLQQYNFSYLWLTQW